MVISESDVIHSITSLKNKSSSGPDGLPPTLFKHLKYVLCRPLTTLFNQLICVGEVPLAWKGVFIVPVYKKGVVSNVHNYRPISLTCVISKIMERIVADHLHTNNILHAAQHGFLKRHSTATNLLERFNDWTVCIQDKYQIAVAYIDFHKASSSSYILY